jgi:hypothetical protein
MENPKVKKTENMKEYQRLYREKNKEKNKKEQPKQETYEFQIPIEDLNNMIDNTIETEMKTMISYGSYAPLCDNFSYRVMNSIKIDLGIKHRDSIKEIDGDFWTHERKNNLASHVFKQLETLYEKKSVRVLPLFELDR